MLADVAMNCTIISAFGIFNCSLFGIRHSYLNFFRDLGFLSILAFVATGALYFVLCALCFFYYLQSPSL